MIRMRKPGSCPLRKTSPRGPIKGCEGTCWAFKSCVEHTRNERDYEEWQTREVERLDNLWRESLNPVRAS